MDLQLKGKKALVTGSTAGIGFAIAAELAAEGASVWINGRTSQRVDEAAKKIKGDVHGIAADCSTASGINVLVAKLGEVDILINNMGIFDPKPFVEIPDADWMRFFETNVMSGVRLSRAYLPKMLKKNWGRIIFVSSESGLNIPAEMIHYGMTKTAQLAVSRGLAELTAGTAVTVNSVLPGPTRSEGVEVFLEQMAKAGKKDIAALEKDFFAHVRPSSLLKRFETPEEIAHMTALLCSPLASGTNGAAVRVDGGVVRSIG
jgi:NAD(P)-dependent dehydrogenase (short-subunit alcohol dehydrogenase family)